MASQPEIDRLIEAGLALYGLGDLDGALSSWEQALLHDPENPQANSYVDYVRQNYSLLTSEEDTASDAPSAPFAIADDDDPEYQIEIVPGDPLKLPLPANAPLYMDPKDAGWVIADDHMHRRPRGPLVDDEPQEVTRAKPSSSAQHPVVAALDLELPMPPSRDSGNGTFEDQTREYPGSPPALPATTEFRGDQLTPGYGAPGDSATPGYEHSQLTDIRKRELGFVQPAAPEPPKKPRRATTSIPPELKMTIRTPGELDAETNDLALPSGNAERPRVASSLAEVSYDDPTAENRSQGASDELLDSLPTPTPTPAALRRTGAQPVIRAASTRDLPAPTRAPAPVVDVKFRQTGAMPVERNHQETQPIPLSIQQANLQQSAPTNPPPFASTPAPPELPATPPPIEDIRPPGYDLVSAPTRDLGMRAAAGLESAGNATPVPRKSKPSSRPPASVGTDDEPTVSRKPLSAARLDTPGGDFRHPFDPVDSRSAEILDIVDVDSPESEAKDERTRRRITRLFERAAEWTRSGEVDRAVAAVDLALSEDPNSALAQKLIHRNRETMMTVFQTFLGDLERQPVLAQPLHELGGAPISPRAAFLLSRVDGTLSLDEILDVSGMPRIEAYRYLCQLFLRGILR